MYRVSTRLSEAGVWVEKYVLNIGKNGGLEIWNIGKSENRLYEAVFFNCSKSGDFAQQEKSQETLCGAEYDVLICCYYRFFR
ncbi:MULTISPECIES: hypothetical protein [Chryseobacterium]|uniref:Uncharacterized protein n=1 Tax=Chryseobacterium taihuense TaxID=1141221 RepID=A0A4U8WE59_9FLAO|nr:MULTISPECIES: hypothetical protein [Chryseobacterium]QQV02096.1 hypothetical protein I6I61_13575 [Chryseobacterium sp. FDAARGOS 1104]VFB04672.1 Uncharacterised protein [Chryseobacterium taihuense]